MKKKKKMPLAYSYLRFSSPQQATGDSLRRQVEAREQWLAKHPGVTLDQSLVMTDAGRSAFNRKDWATYALARFVECIKSGRVEPGSFLLVENLDRLSREDAGAATELFLSIVNKGIVVVQLSPIVMEFARPVNVQSLMFAIVELSRGNSESAAKSERVGKAWSQKQKNAGSKVVTKRLPGWVDYQVGKLVLNAEKAKTVRRLFQMARDGHGVHTIAMILNDEKVPVIGRTTFKGRAVVWSSTTIHHILKSRAVVGEYTPYKCRTAGRKPVGEPVPNYFPAVIDENTFHAVQGAIKARDRVGKGKKGSHVNLFAGLLVDMRTGSPMTYRHHNSKPTQLYPTDAINGKGAAWVSFPADAFERALLSHLVELKATDIDGNGGVAAKKVESLAGQLAEVDDLIKGWTAKMDDPGIIDVVAKKLSELHSRRKVLAVELSDAQREASSPLAEAWGEFKSLVEKFDADKSDELRLKVRAALRRTIVRVETVFRANSGRTRLACVDVWFSGSPVAIPGSPHGGNRRSVVVMVSPDGEVRAKSVGLWTPPEWVTDGAPDVAQRVKWTDSVDLDGLWATLTSVKAAALTARPVPGKVGPRTTRKVAARPRPTPRPR